MKEETIIISSLNDKIRFMFYFLNNIDSIDINE